MTDLESNGSETHSKKEEGKRGVSRLREIMRRPRRESDGNQADVPFLQFSYNDTDCLQAELAELYSYTEEEEFHENVSSFESLLNQFEEDESSSWLLLSDSKRISFIMYLSDRLEVIDVNHRRQAARALLYLLQGVFKETTENCMELAKDNALLLYNCGIFTMIQQLLAMEAENTEAAQRALEKPSISIADSIDLRLYLNILYMMVEIIRHFSPTDPEVKEVGQSLKKELAGGIDTEENPPFAFVLFDFVLKFCAGASSHYPIKKILLLLWKVLLFTLGGFQELATLMKESRKAAGLKATFGEEDHGANTVELEKHHQLRPSTPVDEEAQVKPRKTIDLEDDDIEFVPAPITTSHHYLETVMLLRPKVREKDILTFLESCRKKYVGFQLPNDSVSTAGLPPSIIEGLDVLKSHVYKSLSEVQVQAEEERADRPFSKGIHELPVTNVEVLYKSLLPNFPQYMIALLKILLASAPTAKAKTESINILTDILPEEMPTVVVQSMQLGIDVNRHKEIMVKSISALILLLLKHLKVNHAYQFEFVSQHLVFANCIPLVLKFFNQNISAYVAAKNSITQLNFPSCVIYDKDEITSESLEQAAENTDYCWRNLFSCINLLRILQKLTKWKYSRTMMLVVFKSAPILKRALKIKEENLQMYVLKLLKTQIKYLGRNWRKSNMRIMSLIYHKIRHRLNDDWAFGNDVDARPWDFQTEECAIRHSVDLFNFHHYEATREQRFPEDLQPSDYHLHSVLQQKVVLSDTFKKDCTKWLEREVYCEPTVNWQQLLS